MDLKRIQMKLESWMGLTGHRWKNTPNGLYSINLHRVGDLDKTSGDPNVYSCTQEQLSAHLAFLKTQFDIVSLNDVKAFVANPKMLSQRRCLTITFDDGYADNYDCAFPILQSHHVPAAFFIATGLIGNSVLPWWDKVAFVLKNSPLNQVKLKNWKHPVCFKGDMKLFIRGVLKEIKATGVELEQQIKELEEVSDFQGQYPTPEFMSWEQLKLMHQQGMTIGAHSHHHYILSALTDEDILFELQHSKHLLEKNLGINVNAFSYPVGNQSTYNDGVIEALKSSGYELAFNFRPGVNFHVDKKRYDLHRFPIEPNMTPADFKQMVSYAKVY
ncbi:polysaccharide deacetylase family protein [Alteromonas sp. C1M14]|uniref:polysaccharide deacetylase family protein n=1 Tax=Alteromonas sp. C1M14 TaxID=2841567 RepID=UPI001C098621|nr:polysaccharide deacetylase family protein [Alteromonas sp. C1M14]